MRFWPWFSTGHSYAARRRCRISSEAAEASSSISADWTAYTGATHRVHVVTAKAGTRRHDQSTAVELAPRKITVKSRRARSHRTKRDGEEPAHRKNAHDPRPAPRPAQGHIVHGPASRRPQRPLHHRKTIHISGGVYLP